jgi:hypothetical protein
MLRARSRCRTSHERIATMPTIFAGSPTALNDSWVILGGRPENGRRVALSQGRIKGNCRNIAIALIDTQKGEGKAHTCAIA